MCPYHFWGIIFPLTIPDGNVTWNVCNPPTVRGGIWPKLGRSDAALLKFEPWIKWPKGCKCKWLKHMHPSAISKWDCFVILAIFTPNPLQKFLHSWSCFSKLLVNSINPPMPLQQISLLLQARRIHFCCLRPESSMKMCPKGAQEPGYNKEKSANCFATT